jgi:hypothetical protein
MEAGKSESVRIEVGVSMLDTEKTIRERAYAIWEASGRPHGRDRDHWFQAVREITLTVPPPGAVTRLRQAAKAAARTAAAKKERV